MVGSSFLHRKGLEQEATKKRNLGAFAYSCGLQAPCYHTRCMVLQQLGFYQESSFSWWLSPYNQATASLPLESKEEMKGHCEESWKMMKSTVDMSTLV